MQGDQTDTFLIVLAAVIIVLALIWFFLRQRKTTKLRDRYGDEYDRTVERVGGRDKAEHNLAGREKRVSGLDIRPLTSEERDRFTGEWHEAKTLFVDSPQEAVLRGDRLLAAMMVKRGYPMEDFDRRYEDLTVDHAEVANHYREGHEIADKAGNATTEEMRRALNHYEKLFEEMVRDAEAPLHQDAPLHQNDEEHPAASSVDSAGVDTTVTYDSEVRPIRPS